MRTTNQPSAEQRLRNALGWAWIAMVATFLSWGFAIFLESGPLRGIFAWVTFGCVIVAAVMLRRTRR